MKRLQDITADIGPLYPNAETTIPMYSFDRPATILWQGVYDAMRADGFPREASAARSLAKEIRGQTQL